MILYEFYVYTTKKSQFTHYSHAFIYKMLVIFHDNTSHYFVLMKSGSGVDEFIAEVKYSYTSVKWTQIETVCHLYVFLELNLRRGLE